MLHRQFVFDNYITLLIIFYCMKRFFLLLSLLLFSINVYADDNNLCLKITTTSAGANSWDHQVQFDLESPMAVGHTYQLSMIAKASMNVEVGFWPVDTQSTNRNQWGNSDDVQYEASKKVNGEWNELTWNFTAKFPLDELAFVFGSLNGDLFFDDVKLIDTEVGVNMVINGDFAEKSLGKWKHLSYTGETIELVGNDYVAPAKPEAPVIPDTWDFVEQGDPNFHIYLCIGQSNMEGATPAEAIDNDVDERFQMMAAVDFSNPKRKMGEWYTAVPPLCRQGTGLSPADYFGRTLVEKMPDIKVGVINVAVGGAKIELFMEEEKDAYIRGEQSWFQNFCAQYNNDPLGRLIEMGKIAQKSGTIKGILLHQGESNNGQTDWAKKVAKVYTRICYYLGLDPAKTPLLAGETRYENMGGGCSWHNQAAMPLLKKEIPNSYVISADGITGRPDDAWHFSAEGYREFGRRYAATMLEILGTDDITKIESNNSESIAYDLFGNKVTSATSGIMIKYGQKILNHK